jgi:radical SAM/Cys-rich protein
MRETLEHLLPTDFPAIFRRKLSTVQANLGYLCNQACLHCHVNAGPTRKELMDEATVDMLLDFLSKQHIQTLDVTGGAPEMNPHFRKLLTEASAMGVQCIDRCNLTIIEQPGYDWVVPFLAEHRVAVVASLPCYLEDNVDAQRGSGVFKQSIDALKKLNQVGYGQPDSGLNIDLVYNPQGPSLPPGQVELQASYKAHLWDEFGLVFNQLFTVANMPIKRFGSTLLSHGQFDDYMTLLKDSYRSSNLDDVMCRDLISVDYQGYVYDCDFNQMLGLQLGHGGHAGNTRQHLSDLIHVELENAPITIANHCYGCTAGQGSSCGGALNA